ncbi:uncharacterized protein [Triticum aestivum]|uniref:uncharacterized protein isoform X1 n=1 Tax=Triticum aestivum TaxID=4565 RepID=UPI001D020642|nr:uncharacterized protein LOC123124259 isoform X1 [Triticum aestivum]
MSLRRRLPGLSANLRRSLSTAAASSQSHPPWAIIDGTSMVDRSSSAPVACFRPVQPPGVSDFTAPAHLLSPRPRPAAPDSNVVQSLFGSVGAVSGDGHLLLTYHDLRAEGPCTKWDFAQDLEIQRFVCNPVSGQMLRLPDIGRSRRTLVVHHMGLLTQGAGGGPPGRFAVADLLSHGAIIPRFLSEEGEWRTVIRATPSLRLPRLMEVNQETVAFGGRLWWVDLTLGAISVDPFDDRLETRFVELPSGSVLPARAPTDSQQHFGDRRRAADDQNLFMREVAKHRRIGVSEGRLRYAEVSPHDPFVLSCFALDDEGSCWTLEHQVALKQVLADGGYPSAAPQIAVLDPLHTNAIYLKVGEHLVVVDMRDGKVIGASPLQEQYFSLVSCVLPPWLGSSRIPTPGIFFPGKKDDMEATDDLVSCI